MNSQIDFSTLKNSFSGEIIFPDNPAYGQASTAFTKKGSPLAVVRPKSAQDVATAIKFAKDNSLTLSIKSGGHGSLGFGTNDGGLVIDVKLLDTIEVLDAQKNLVRVGSGAVWGDVAKKLAEHGLAISSGDTKSVGVGGLTLGGGIGWMMRKYGLTIDSLKAAEVITADGQILKVSEAENSDLFWAIRGGGGNFGVVTSFEFEAHPIKDVYFANIVYSVENLEHLLKGWRDILRSAPEELTSNFMVMPPMMGNPASMMVMCCYASDDEVAAHASLDQLIELGSVIKQDIQKKAYSDILEEAHLPEGIKIISKTSFVKDFSDELIQFMAEKYGKDGSPMLMMRSMKGMSNRVPVDATAFAHRDVEALIASVAFMPVDAPDTAAAPALETWRKIEEFTEGAYINFLYEIDERDILRAYPSATFERLKKIKQQYDPTNLFNQNINIRPT